FQKTMVWLVPAVLVVMAGVFYLYGQILRLLSKTTLRNRVVLITDSASALGKECAKVFHKGGARLILCGKNWEKLEDLAEPFSQRSGTHTHCIKGRLDFSDMELMPEVVSDVLDCYGCLDVLIFNSSMKVKAPVQTLSLEMDKMVMDANYFGPITLAKGVLPSMITRRSGHIILVNSIQGKLAVPFRTTYAASKHAVQAFFDCLRAEVQEYGISVTLCDPRMLMSRLFENAVLTRQKPHGVSPEEMAGELLKTLSSKKNEIIMAHSISKAAIYARSFFPNFFFAVTAAGVRSAAAMEHVQ
uniref:Dehydrogenase/reductase (SDR family) member 7C n=1 Tax=Pygocentrus nattereri TaxID=42514 RepID=A0AAR2JP75_PYGNA